MSRPAGKPLLGAALGVALAFFVLLLLQQAGIVPPTRLIVFSVIGVCVSAGSLALTVTLLRPAAITVQAISLLLVAFSLTGIPAMGDHGRLDGGCDAFATSTTPDEARPADTSVGDPFDIDPGGTLNYRVTTPEPFPDWTYSASMDIGGFPVGIWGGQFPMETFGPVFEGTEDTAHDTRILEDITGVKITGVYHLSGWIAGNERRCDIDLYVRIKPANPFSGPILAGAWTGAAFVILIGAVYGAQMAHLRREKR